MAADDFQSLFHFQYSLHNFFSRALARILYSRYTLEFAGLSFLFQTFFINFYILIIIFSILVLNILDWGSHLAYVRSTANIAVDRTWLRNQNYVFSYQDSSAIFRYSLKRISQDSVKCSEETFIILIP